MPAPVYDSGPWNLQAGNSARFVVEFLSSTGDPTVPATGTLTVTYTNTSGAQQVDTTAMTLINNFFTATWSSTSAAYGLAVWDITGTGGLSKEGNIRIIERVDGD